MRLTGTYNGGLFRSSQAWDEVTRRPNPACYLDPLVARQKRAANQGFIRACAGGAPVRVLKTDVFEEAYGEDRILFDLFPEPYAMIGTDIAFDTVRRARERCPVPDSHFLAADVRRLGLRDESVDMVISTSTLDHFATEAEFQTAVNELVRILKPGGRLVITVDNPQNPLYRLLRLLSRAGCGPFPLGYSPSLPGLIRSLRKAGLEITNTALLIHNPRVVSTLLFLALRRLLGRYANAPIEALLRLFGTLALLPTRRFSACFLGACGQKRLV